MARYDPDKGYDAETKEEHQVWKQNMQHMYDCMAMKELEWPSLTCQWLPDCVELEDRVEHQLLLGTQTSGQEPDYLLVYDVIDKDTPKRPEDFMEFRLRLKLDHPGEVNRAAYNPLYPQLVATKSVSGDVLVFDLHDSQHSQKPSPDGKVRSACVLRGHEKEGYALNWSPHTNGLVASGADDGLVCLWDVSSACKKGGSAGASGDKHLVPLRTLKPHGGKVVEQVCFGPRTDTLASVGDDGFVAVWDGRQTEVAQRVRAHMGEANACAFGAANEHLVITGGGDHDVNIFDRRKFTKRIHGLAWHEAPVQFVAFAPVGCPGEGGVLASSGDDKRVVLWDLAKIGEPQDAEDRACGPPERTFVHAGHMAEVSEVAWSKNDPGLVCSVSTDNFVHVWRPCDLDEDEDEAE